MAVNYVEFEQARAASGLRMIVVGGLPSPWGEAAKGALYAKGVDWLAVRLRYDDKALRAWSPKLSAPVAVWEDEPPVDRARDIVALADRIAPNPALAPAPHREEILAFVDDLADPGGLGWDRRVQLVDWGLAGKGGFRLEVAKYLAAKYGHDAEAGAAATAKVVARLAALADGLRAQEAAGSGYVFGDALTAADIYLAAFMGIFDPLPHDKCPMAPASREAFSLLDETTRAALDPILLAHRDRIYDAHLETPLKL